MEKYCKIVILKFIAMKKIIKMMLYCTMLALNTARAQSNIVSVSEEANTIKVSFILPAYSVQDAAVPEFYNNSTRFKSIVVKGFGVVGNVGFPELPQLTTDIHIPKESYDLSVSMSNAVTEIITLETPVVPAQRDMPELLYEQLKIFVL
jgi:hypothetical protein